MVLKYISINSMYRLGVHAVSTLILLCGIGYSPLVKGQSGHRLTGEVAVGYHTEDFQWSIAGSAQGTNPNIYSEVIWKNLTGPMTNVSLQWNPLGKLVVQYDFQYGRIRGGSVSDMDYLGDNRTQNSYKGEFSADKGSFSKHNFILGYNFKANRFKLTPAIGWVIHSQRLYLLDGPMALNSRYFTSWKGLNVRLSTTFELSKKLEVANCLVLERLKYNAAADWNLIGDFQHPISFIDDAKGFGGNADLKFIYHLSPNIDLNLTGAYYYAKTAEGTDQLFLKNGRQANTMFNGAERKSFGVYAGVAVSL